MAAKKDDLRARTKAFASAVIYLFTKLPRHRDEIGVLGRQLLRSGTSVAANYREASRARTDADFISKIEICTQEADESILWLELLEENLTPASLGIDALIKESNELIAIFVTMSKRVKSRLRS